jgi:hypothetical protein
MRVAVLHLAISRKEYVEEKYGKDWGKEDIQNTKFSALKVHITEKGSLQMIKEVMLIRELHKFCLVLRLICYRVYGVWL